MTRIIVSFIIVAFCGSCFSQTNAESARLKSEALAKIDIKQCEADGGDIKEVGMMQIPACVFTYKDAGNACQDSADCEGLCITTDKSISLGDKTSGTCQEKNRSDGCYAELEDGMATPFVCVD